MSWKRHTLIDISDAGRAAILAELAGRKSMSYALRERLKSVLLPNGAGVRVPGTVRREDESPRPGCVPVGFSDPLAGGAQRLRIAAFARSEDVVGATTPYEVMSLPVPGRSAATLALAAARDRAESLSLPLGVWGSAAMELYTGLPCTRDDSDLDLLVAAGSLRRLSCFMTGMGALEARFHLRIDVEVDLPNGYGVQLRELLGRGRTVLGKGLTGVALLPRMDILAELPPDRPFAAGSG